MAGKEAKKGTKWRWNISGVKIVWLGNGLLELRLPRDCFQKGNMVIDMNGVRVPGGAFKIGNEVVGELVKDSQEIIDDYQYLAFKVKLLE